MDMIVGGQIINTRLTIKFAKVNLLYQEIEIENDIKFKRRWQTLVPIENEELGQKGSDKQFVDKPSFVRLFADFFDTLLYKNPLRRQNPTSEHTYKSNATFWQDAIAGTQFELMRIHLEKFHMTEWIPSAPGRYFTEQATQSRLDARSAYDWKNREYFPYGKFNMVLGGIGSLRLGARMVEGTTTHFLGASSTGVSHEGIPIATSKEQYGSIIELIRRHGGCLVNISGALRLLPTKMSIIRYDREVPRFCFFADKIVVVGPSQENDLRVSVAVMFPADSVWGYEKGNIALKKDGYTTGLCKMWSFYQFNPCGKENLTSAVNWLKDYAIRYSKMREPPIFSDFDEFYDHFENPVEFPLVQLQDNSLNLERFNAYMPIYGPIINVQEVKILGDVFSNITNSNIVNRSLVEKSFNKVKRNYGKDTAKVLVRIAEEVSKSGNKEAGELFENFNEELLKPEPRKSVLKNIWSGIERALPTIVQLADVVAQISKLFIN